MTQLDSEYKKDLSNTPDNLDEDVSFRASSEFKDILEELADEHNMSISHICRTAIVRLVKQEAKAAEASDYSI